MTVQDNQWLESCAQEVGEFALRSAFRRYKFVYGTMGKGSAVVKAAKTMFSRKSRFKGEEQILARELNLFDPGVRGTTYLAGSNTQMMDMYYGQANNNLYQLRDRHIGDFVHRALKFKGDYLHTQSGRDTYMLSYKTSIEGWDAWAKGGPRINDTTITVEISRVIRWGIKRFGGHLTFEGREVYYSQVFDKKAYHGDTDIEAMNLFKYFSIGSGHTVPFGEGNKTGKLTFMWNGVPTVPTHCHFLSNWAFDGSKSGLAKQKESIEQSQAKQPQYGAFHSHSAKAADGFGAQMHHSRNRGDITEYLKRDNVNLDFDLWNRFADRPPGALQAISSDTIIKLLS